MTRILDLELGWPWGAVLDAAIVIVGSIVAGLFVHLLVFNLMRRVSSKTTMRLDDLLVKYCRGPSRLLFPLAVLSFAMPVLEVHADAAQLLRHLASICFIAGVAWLLIRVGRVVTDLLETRFDVDVADNLRSRQVHTQLRLLRRVVNVIVVILMVSAILMTFEKVRQLGTSILASAGIVGVIVGMAAQRTLANLLAGIQIAITQPIRLEDVVIVEGEWGWIEEITVTYVVVRIWDLRRLVVPISYFIEKPFQNWTRVTADILGTVFFHMDYSVPVEAVRQELRRIVDGNKLWDGKVCGVQVTEAKDKTLEVRALVSAADSSSAWDLRCEVREKMIAFLQSNYPTALPRLRAEIAPPLVPAG